MPPKVALRGSRSQAGLLPHLHAAQCFQASVAERTSDRRPSTDLIETVLNSLNACFFRIDRRCGITDVNRSALHWLRTDRANIIGRNFRSVFDRVDAQVLGNAIERAVFASLAAQSVYRPGCPVDLQIFPDPQGAIVCFKDRAEQPCLDVDARRSDDLLRASVNSLSAHVVILDEGGTIFASNLAWQRFAMANKLMQTGGRQNYLDVCEVLLGPCLEARRIRTALQSVLSRRRRSVREVYAWREGGHMRWFELLASRLDCDQGRYVVINTDITAAREAEQALGEAAAHALTLQEEERQKIASELHDSTVQHIVAAGLNLISLGSRVDARGEVPALIKSIENSLAEASKELRTFTYLLHPPFLEANSLAETLHNYVDGFGRRTGVKTRLRIGRGIDALPSVLQRPILRIAQEALANVHRHASASCVLIDLRCIMERLHLVVRDNGRGMEGAERSGQRFNVSPGLGVGIPGIRARLRQFGGDLAIKTGRGGTTLHAFVPVAHAFQD